MIYVDDLLDHSPSLIKEAARRHGTRWCHMWTDGDIEELHIFAGKIGLKREYFQKSRILFHYDLTPGKRILAMFRGAKYKRIVEFIKEKYYPMAAPCL